MNNKENLEALFEQMFSGGTRAQMTPEDIKKAAIEHLSLTIEALSATLDTIISNPDVLDKIAKLCRKFHDSLTLAGFHDENAMRILLAVIGKKGADK